LSADFVTLDQMELFMQGKEKAILEENEVAGQNILRTLLIIFKRVN